MTAISQGLSLVIAWVLMTACLQPQAQGAPATNTPAPTLAPARPASATIETATAPIRQVEGVRKLSRAEANRGLPVRLHGIVTYVNQGWGNLFLQDDTGGIGAWPWLPGCEAKAGDVIDFEGTTEQTGFGPSLRPSKITVRGRAALPTAQRHSYGFILTGSDDAQWIEVEGIVQKAEGQQIRIMIQGGEITAWVNDMTGPDAERLVDARIRIPGVCSPDWNDRKQIVGFALRTSSTNLITVLEPAPADPFSIPATPIAELLRYNPDSATAAALSHRAKIRGVATALGTSVLYVQDETSGARVEPSGDAAPKPGEILEVVGFAQIFGRAALLKDAVVRSIGQTNLPSPVSVSGDPLFGGDFDARRIRVRGVLIEPVLKDQTRVLRMQIDNRIVRALFPTGQVARVTIRSGSALEVEGVCAETVAAPAGQALPDLWLASPEDVVVIQRAPWWKFQYTLAVLGALLAMIGAGLVWVRTLRRQVEEQTCELKHEIEERARAQEEVRKTHGQLLDASRQAGRAEVATNVLHNVGNVLNSVNVSCNMVSQRIRTSDFSTLEKLADLMEANAAEPSFLSENPKGRIIPGYLRQLAQKKAREKEILSGEVKSLKENLNHIMEIVAMQQSHAKVSGVAQAVAAPELVEDALRLTNAALTRHDIKVIRQFEATGPITVDKHKALQILVNLLQNAKNACAEAPVEEKLVTVITVARGADFVKILVVDNGVGIAPENLTRMFAHGFTTRKDGHGFGLHSGALAAREMGGSLTAWSAGPGRGATFTLELPRENSNAVK